PQTVFREFVSKPAEQGIGSGLVCSSDGRWLLTVQPELRLYDAMHGDQVASLPRQLTFTCAFFDQDNPAIFYSRLGKAIYRREFSCDTNSAKPLVHWGEEKLLARHPNALVENVIDNGRTWVTHTADDLQFWADRDPKQARHISIRAPYDRVATTQDGRWAAVPINAKDQV